MSKAEKLAIKAVKWPIQSKTTICCGWTNIGRLMIRRLFTSFLAVLLLFAECRAQRHPIGARTGAARRTNWAVAEYRGRIFAFYGLGNGKTYRDIARDVYLFNPSDSGWQRISEMPVTEGRLASSAVTIGNAIYVIGGYTVSADGVERSTPEVYRFDPSSHAIGLETDIPVPVDDTVALPWHDRWIVLVSGWHDSESVENVQLYDTVYRTWTSGTKWPGKPVFGHAGGIVGDKLVICDGVASTRDMNGKNQFELVDGCWRGLLDMQRGGPGI